MQNNEQTTNSYAPRRSSHVADRKPAFPPRPAPATTSFSRGMSSFQNEPHSNAPSTDIISPPQAHHNSNGEASGYFGSDGAWYPYPQRNFDNYTTPSIPGHTTQQQAPYWRTCYHHTANPNASGACYGGVCGPSSSYFPLGHGNMVTQQAFGGYQSQSNFGLVYGDAQFGITNPSFRMSQPANSHQMYSGPPNIGGQAAYNPYYHQAVPNHPQQALIQVSQQHISGSSLVTGPSLANGRLPSPPKMLQNNPSASTRASGAPLEEPESDRRKDERAIQRSHLPWHHKTIPKPRWNKQNPKRCWKKFRLSMSDLKVGMIVYVIPNGEWSGDRPAIVLSLEDDKICLLCCTSFSERDIWRKYAHFSDAWVAEEHKSQYVLIADGGRTRPHNFLPVVGLQQRMELPKTTYVDFYMKYECGIDDIIRFGDSQRSAVNIYVVDQPSMAAIEWYLQVRHDLMTQTEQCEARKTHYREVVGPDAARAAAARGTRMASQAGGEDFGPDVNGQ